MRPFYEQSQWGWNGDAKFKELNYRSAFYLVARWDDSLSGFCHFRFLVDDNRPVLYIYEIQIDEKCQRCGLGKRFLTILEEIAVKNHLKLLIATIFKFNVTIQIDYIAPTEKSKLQKSSHSDDSLQEN
uniref:N-alpha-acetyltransferase 40 n=1 Tax=Romanomermis culicivorax TaxID=13658 RepID=A0A915K306_ROMCU